jgi:hypothetical protein
MSDDIRVFECTALSIDQEDWTIGALPCSCGGAWVKGAQTLTLGRPDGSGEQAEGPFDEWDVQCGACGARAIFRFDVSSFFGHAGKVADWVRQQLPEADERLRCRIARKVGSPFGVRFCSTIATLVNGWDLLTLLYLHAQVSRAIELVARRAGERVGQQ